MSRWEPGARQRLEEAALELYAERGFEDTTVADIAARAGLTERTFFRHFADKREVLFGGAVAFQEVFITAIAQAPDLTRPLDTTAIALEAAAGRLEPGRARSRRRQQVIDAHAVLQERELIKLASLSAAMSEALRIRGVPDLHACLTAEAGVAVFRVAFERWISDAEERTLADLVREALDELRVVMATAAP